METIKQKYTKQVSELLKMAEEELSGEPSEENASNALLMIKEVKNLLSKALVMPSLPTNDDIDNYDTGTTFINLAEEDDRFIKLGMTIMRDEILNRINGNEA